MSHAWSSWHLDGRKMLIFYHSFCIYILAFSGRSRLTPLLLIKLFVVCLCFVPMDLWLKLFFDPDVEMTLVHYFPRGKNAHTQRHLPKYMYCSDFAGSLTSIYGPTPKIVVEIYIMTLKCDDTSAPVAIICKDADVRPIKKSRTGAFLTPQLPDSFLESRLFGLLL